MITLLETPLFLISVPRDELNKYMQPIVGCILFNPRREFFSLTGNSIEWSVVANKETADAFLTLDPACAVCKFPLQAYQVDIPVDSINRIDRLSRVLSAAHISIFYLSTYQTDFVFVKQRHTKRVLETLKSNGFEVDCAIDLDIDDNLLRNSYTDTNTSFDNLLLDTQLFDQELLDLKKEFSPDVPLTLVGLNNDSKEAWSLILIRLLFYTTPSLS